MTHITEKMLDALVEIPYERGKTVDHRTLPGTANTINALESRGLITTRLVEVGTIREHFEVELTDRGAVERARCTYTVGSHVCQGAIAELEGEAGPGIGPNTELVFDVIGRRPS